MNKRQRVALYVAALAAVVMLLFPPVRVDDFQPPWSGDILEGDVLTHYVRYVFVGNRWYGEGTSALSGDLYWPRLRLQFQLLILVTLALLMILRSWDSLDGGEDGRDREAPDGPVDPPRSARRPMRRRTLQDVVD